MISECQLNWKYPDGWLALIAVRASICSITPCQTNTASKHRHMTCIQKVSFLIKSPLPFLPFLLKQLLMVLKGSLRQSWTTCRGTSKTFTLYPTLWSIKSWWKRPLADAYKPFQKWLCAGPKRDDGREGNLQFNSKYNEKNGVWRRKSSKQRLDHISFLV